MNIQNVYCTNNDSNDNRHHEQRTAIAAKEKRKAGSKELYMEMREGHRLFSASRSDDMEGAMKKKDEWHSTVWYGVKLGTERERKGRSQRLYCKYMHHEASKPGRAVGTCMYVPAEFPRIFLPAMRAFLSILYGTDTTSICFNFEIVSRFKLKCQC